MFQNIGVHGWSLFPCCFLEGLNSTKLYKSVKFPPSSLRIRGYHSWNTFGWKKMHVQILPPFTCMFVTFKYHFLDQSDFEQQTGPMSLCSNLKKLKHQNMKHWMCVIVCRIWTFTCMWSPRRYAFAMVNMARISSCIQDQLTETYDRGEPAIRHKWTGWVWEITGWSSKLQENYRSF